VFLVIYISRYSSSKLVLVGYTQKLLMDGLVKLYYA